MVNEAIVIDGLEALKHADNHAFELKPLGIKCVTTRYAALEVPYRLVAQRLRKLG